LQKIGRAEPRSYEQQKKECALKEEHKSDPDSVYMWQGDKCVGTYNGIPKEDVIMEWNCNGTYGAEESGKGFPTYYQLDSIKKLPVTGNIILKLYRKDQQGPQLARLDKNADTLQVWVNRGLVTIYQGDTLLISDEPTEELFEKYQELGIFIAQWSPELAKAHNKNVIKTGEGTIVPRNDKYESILGRRFAKQQIAQQLRQYSA